MALELANNDFTKLEWVQNNLTVYDFIKKSCYRKWQSYNEWLQTSNKNNQEGDLTE